MTFWELIESGRPYLNQFDFDRYPACFARFEADAGPLFAALTGADLGPRAEELVQALARQRAGLPRRAQRELAFAQKQVLGLFLAPAALRHSPAAQAFSERLQALWCAEQPRNVYLLSTYEQIMKGFDANLLGLPLRKSKKSSLSKNFVF